MRQHRSRTLNYIAIALYFILQSLMIFLLNPGTTIAVIVGLFGGIIVFLLWNMDFSSTR